jgi:hypothetical protein
MSKVHDDIRNRLLPSSPHAVRFRYEVGGIMVQPQPAIFFGAI